jgi:hypothetical protein
MVEEKDDYLKRSRLDEKERVENELQEVKDILSRRDSVHEKVRSELDEEIRVQKNRLSRASKNDEPRIRGILQDLYRERREEVVSDWRDRVSWVERKLDLERELDELESIEELDFDG